MNPHYHWPTEGVEFLSFFLFAPALSVFVAYKAWREKAAPRQYGIRCVAFGVLAVVLFFVAKWLDADIRSPLYFLQFACVVLSLLLLGICVGCFFSVLLNIWNWHKSTRVV